jgi:hypothetical protein
LIDLVPLAHIDAVWPDLAEGMKKACIRGGGDLTPSWLFEICRKGEALLFVAHEDGKVMAGLVCRVENWSGTKVLRILALTGHSMKTWLSELRAYRAWLDNLDIETVIFEGRKGWGILPGAEVIRQVYRVDINGRQ